MKYLKISNKGEVEPNAFTLVGASSKRNDETKIGYFGSGTKYALAYFFRNNYEVRIFSGVKEIKFEISEQKFRDETFKVLVVNGKESSITLEMGIQWKLWQAVREFYSNALDEGLDCFEMVEEDFETDFNTYADETAIYIKSTPELDDLFFNIDEYFLMNRTPIFETEYGAIYPKTGAKARIYRKGIKAYETNKNALFDYDLKKLVIDENRLAKYNWQVAEYVWNILYGCQKKEVIRTVLTEYQTKGLIERELDEGIISPNTSLMSTQWIEATEGRQVFPETLGGWLSDEEKLKTDFVGTKLYNTLVAKIGDSIKPKSVTFAEDGKPYTDAIISDVRAKVLSDSLDFFQDADFVMDYKIKVVDFNNSNVLGSILKEEKLILLDVQSLDLGIDQTINTLIEEYIHLKFGVYDETRGFQNAIITEFINYMKLKKDSGNKSV